MSTPLDHRSYGRAQVHIFPSKDLSGRAAASRAAGIIRDAISKCGRARIVVATGNSQLELIDALTHKESVDWDAVEAFHMDEYVGIAADHPGGRPDFTQERLGAGPVIYLADGGMLVNLKLRDFLQQVARESNIPVQTEVTSVVSKN